MCGVLHNPAGEALETDLGEDLELKEVVVSYFCDKIGMNTESILLQYVRVGCHGCPTKCHNFLRWWSNKKSKKYIF